MQSVGMKTVFTGAIDIGGTKIQAGIVDDTGELLAEACFGDGETSGRGE